MPRLLARFTAQGHWVATVAVAVAVALGPPAAATYFDISICCFVPCLVVRSPKLHVPVLGGFEQRVDIILGCVVNLQISCPAVSLFIAWTSQLLPEAFVSPTSCRMCVTRLACHLVMLASGFP